MACRFFYMIGCVFMAASNCEVNHYLVHLLSDPEQLEVLGLTPPLFLRITKAGNTCYVNSVLQVLYRTPGFVELITNLAIEVRLVQEATTWLNDTSDINKQVDGSTSLNLVADISPSCMLIRSLDQLFTRMRQLEMRPSTGDSGSIILRPYDVLDNIRLLNPMFSDNLQHDAHELLRCLMAFIDDATAHLTSCRRDILKSSAIHVANNLIPCADCSEGENVPSSLSPSACRQTCSLPMTPCNPRPYSCAAGDNSNLHLALDHQYCKLSAVYGINTDLPRKNGTYQPLTKAEKTGIWERHGRRTRSLKFLRSASCPEVKVSLQRLSVDKILLSRSLNGLSELMPNSLAVNGLSHHSPDTGLLHRISVKNACVTLNRLPNCSSKELIDHSQSRVSEELQVVHPASAARPVTALTLNQNSEVGYPMAYKKTPSHCSMDRSDSAVSDKLLVVNHLEAYDRGLSCRVELHMNKKELTAVSKSSLSYSEKPSRQCKKLLKNEICYIRHYSEPRAICVRDLFGGNMLMRTKCLSCGDIASRSEIYEDIALAVNQSTEPGASAYDWIFTALDEVEKLQGDNRYHCDLCDQLADVERSVHYITAPRVLTLHLKRFAAQSSQVTKTVDNVTVPLVLPCIERQCRLSTDASPTHWYELYGVVAHSGRLASCGHYVAYVRDREADPTGADTAMKEAFQTMSRSAPDLAAVRPSLRPRLKHRFPGCMGQSTSFIDQQLAAHLATIVTTNRTQRRRWFECDDETISVLSEAQFEARLRHAGRVTPYMLFYEKRYLQIAEPADGNLPSGDNCSV